MSELAASTLVGLGGFTVGLVFGATAQRTNFCTMGGISDYVLMGDGRRLRAWVLASAVAIVGTQLLGLNGLIDLGKSIYLTANFGWLGAIVGGLMFGFGMTQTGGCASKTLVRLGGGNLKSLVVAMVVGIVAYMTLRGLIAVARVQLETTNIDLKAYGLQSQAIGEIVARVSGLGLDVARVAAATVVAAVLLWFCFKDPGFRRSPHDLVAGVVIGLCTIGGWVVTGILGADEFEPVALSSVTLVAPTADSLQYLMTFTGASLNFGIALVGGIVVGSFLMSIGSGRFQLEGFADRSDLVRHLGGASLMGMGGVLALGCTVGQGVTGMSTLSLGSLVAWLSILAGGYLGMKYLEEGSLGGAIRAVFVRG